KGFRLFWTWKVRHGQPGRPSVSREIRQLIRRISRENPLWGAPRIHGELLKPGIDIGETSVGKYIVRRRKPPSQDWRTFLENHIKNHGLGGLLHRADDSVSGPVRVPRLSSRAKEERAFQRHRSSDGRVDRAATPGGFSL